MTTSSNTNNIQRVAPSQTLKNQSLGPQQKPLRDGAYWATNGYVPSAAGMMVQAQTQAVQATPATPPPAAAIAPQAFPGSDLLAQFSGNLDALADMCQIRGGKDIERFQGAMTKAQSVAAKATVATDGQQPTAGQLKLSPEQIAAIQSAPSAEAAKAIVLQAIAAQTGVSVDGLDPTHRGRKQNKSAREALNALLGTKVKDGREKNAGSAMLLDAICDSVAKSMRSIPSGTATAAAVAPGANLGDGYRAPVTSPEGPRAIPTPPMMVNVGDYVPAANEVGEMASPLIFDLAGTGLKIKQGEMLEVDIDGDGKKEVITDLDKGIGLLVFDSKSGSAAAGRDHFGDNTDLSAYGIVSRAASRKWDNGFDALRALCEHFELVHGDKQHLDAKDLAFLEKQVGLRMRIDGLQGEDRRFSDVKIARIHLGNPKKIQPMSAAQADGYGNKLMKQEGATFVVAGKTREYADIWFNVQARAKVAPPAPAKAGMLSGALQQRRI